MPTDKRQQSIIDEIKELQRRLDALERYAGGSSGSSSVTSVFGRTGAVLPVSGDYEASEVTNAFDKTVDDLDDLTEGTTNKHYTSTEKTKLAGIETGATADQSDAEIETAYNNQVAVATQAEAEAGTSTTVKRWTPERIGQAISALSTGSTSSIFGAL